MSIDEYNYIATCNMTVNSQLKSLTSSCCCAKKYCCVKKDSRSIKKLLIDTVKHRFYKKKL